MANNLQMIRKLQNALNMKGQRILYNTSQFYSNEVNHPITLHSIKKSVYNEDTGRNMNIELFRSSSMIQCVLFLRDLLFEVEGKELPTNNEVWNTMRDEYKKKEDSGAST